MTHISQKKLKQKVATDLADQLITFISVAHTKNGARILAQELLSQTERVMLAKRLAIVVLLVRGYSFTQINESLGVTNQTVSRILEGVKQGNYKSIIRYAKRYTRHFKKETPVDAFIRVLHLGMPPRASRRWQGLDKFYGLESS